MRRMEVQVQVCCEPKESHVNVPRCDELCFKRRKLVRLELLSRPCRVGLMKGLCYSSA